MLQEKGFEVEKHLGETWYGLQRYEGDTFKANVRPLSEEELGQMIGKLTGGKRERWNFAELLRTENAALLGDSDKVAIVLDGRSKDTPQGFLGDMIEASRMVNVVRSTGRKVIIVTPHTDLFEGNHDPSMSIVAIPETLPVSHAAPWKEDLLGYLQTSIGKTPCIFPMHAATPVLMQLDSGGHIENEDNLALVKKAFVTNGKNPHITPLHWGKFGIHQLQALQITAYLFGIKEVKNWRDFPRAFFNPTREAREVALEVVGSYGCFKTSSEDCPPLYLHPGVATNGSKLITKFYPEDKWTAFINELSGTPYATGSLTFLEPTDEQQATMTLRLATKAIEAGLHVAKVPISTVKRRYDWSLGSFISFLQELAKHGGIIVGCDSMPAGHAGPATGNPAVVLGSHCFNPGFYCPPEKALVVLPSKGPYTSSIEPTRIVRAVQSLCKDPQLLQTESC